MNKDVIIEHYLSQLDRELNALPVGERAEIVTEIRSHILEASAQNPDRKIHQILEDLGSAQSVAQKYLAQKGVPYSAPGVSPMRTVVKWMAIGFGGLMVLSVVSVFAMVWFFTPIISIDEGRGQVKINVLHI